MPITRRRRGLALVAAVAALLAAGLAWSRWYRRPEPLTVVYDLVETSRAAERWSSREVILFGTPDAEPHLADGFYPEGSPVGRSGFVWGHQTCAMSFTWPQPLSRTAVVELMPYGGVRGQAVEVALNGTPVESARLNDRRHRYRISLPATAQKAGENRVRFTFAAAASPSTAGVTEDERRLAAAFYTMVIGPSDDPGLDELLRRGAPLPFEADASSGIPSMTLIGPSAVRYAVRVPQRAEIRFTPELHPEAKAAGESVLFRVTVESRPGEERDLWSHPVAPSDEPGEVSVPVPLPAGSLARIGLHVGVSGNSRAAWGTFKAPRLLGAAAPAPAPRANHEADRLRAAVKGGNVILIVLDAARAKSIGAYGHTGGTTPAIDRLASEGVVFEQAFTPAVYTLAAMSSVWTSQYPDRHHADVAFSVPLPKDRLTLADVLSAQGIATVGFVANQVAGSFNGFDRGFGEFHDLWKTRGSGGAALIDAVEAWLRAAPKKPCFAYLHFREPHAPYDPPPPFDERFAATGPIPKAERVGNGLDPRLKALNRATRPPQPGEIEQLRGLYEGNLAFADAQIDRLRKVLEARELWDDTTIILTADHGEAMFEHGWIGHNTQVYDESIHIPLVVRLARSAGPKGTRVTALVDLRDIAPTIADLFGVLGKGGTEREFTGRSLLGRLHGETGNEFVLSRTVWDRPVYALRDGGFKAILNTRTGVTQLFDLSVDLGETRDVASGDPIRAAFYRQTLENTVAKEAPAREGPRTRTLTREQCESLKALGYVGGDVKCE